MWSWWQSKTRLDESTIGIEDEMPNVHRQEIIRTIREMQLKNIDEPEDELMDAAARGRGRGRAPAKRKPNSRSRSAKKKPKPRAKPRSKSGARPKYRCTGNKCVRVRADTPCPARAGVRNSRLLAADEQTKAAPEPPTSLWTPVTKTTPLPPSSPAPRRVPTKLPPKRPLRPKNPFIGSKKAETPQNQPPNQPKTRGFFVWRKNAPTASPQAVPSADTAKPAHSGARTSNQEDAEMGPTTSVANRSANAAPAFAMTTRQQNKRAGEGELPAGAQQRAVSLPRNKRVPAKRGAPIRKTAAVKKGRVAKKKPPAANQKRGRK